MVIGLISDQTERRKNWITAFSFLKKIHMSLGDPVVFVSVHIFSYIHYQKCSSPWNRTAEAPASLKSLYTATQRPSLRVCRAEI